jgi:hypothetical protein
MTKLKCQIKPKIPMGKGVALALRRLDFVCHLDFDTWISI